MPSSSPAERSMRRISTLTRAQDAALQARLEHAERRRYRKAIHALKSLKVKHSIPHFGDWGREFFPDYVKLAPSLMHTDIIDTLHDFSRARTIGNKEARIAPRSGAKTTWTSKLYTLYAICHELEHYVLLIGETAGQSHGNLKSVKHELTTNRALIDAYPRATGEGSVWNVDEIVTANNIKIEAAGAGKSIRGRTHGPYRPGLIIVDDLDDRDNVRNDDIRQRMWEWLAETLMPMGDDSTNFLCVGTALHEDDTIHRLKKVGEWGWKRYQALIHEPTNQRLWDQWKRLFLDLDLPKDERLACARAFYDARRGPDVPPADDMDAGAVLLWPEREPLYSLMSYRTAYGEKAFQSEKQGDATLSGNTEFAAGLFGPDIWFSEWPALTLTALALDPSKGKNEKNDYSAFCWGGLGEDGLLYVDADIDRRDASEVVADGIRIYRETSPMLFGLETIMFQSLFADLFHMAARAIGIVLPVTQINPHESKMVRIRQLTPYLTQNRIRFRAGSRGAEMLVDQLKKFPLGKHDDGCFVAGTMIETQAGPQPIETIAVGDMVCTRRGFSRVTAAGFTGIKDVIEITGDNGRSLIGTPSHPVFNGIDFEPMHSVTMMWSCETTKPPNPKLSCSTGSHFDVTQTRNNGRIRCITRPMPGIAETVLERCIKRCGGRLMAQFQMGMKSIIGTGTRSITRLKIWSASRRKSIVEGMPSDIRNEQEHRRIYSNLPLSITSPSRGTNQMLEKNGTNSTGSKVGEIASGLMRHANTAERHSRLCSLVVPDGAQPNANNEPIETVADMQPVLVVGRKRHGVASVFNLTVENESEYFANGLLVHNCDALHMMIELLKSLDGQAANDEYGSEVIRA